jgi:carbohydrate-selective porin OprB
LGIAFAAMKINHIDYKFDNLLEITYRAQITPAIAIQPTFQTYLNAKDKNGETNPAYVIGVRAEVNF